MIRILLLLAIVTVASCSRPPADVVDDPKPVDLEFVGDVLDTPFRGEYENAQQLISRGQVAEAEQIYAALRQKEPDSTHPLVGLAGCHMVRRAPVPAIKLYEQALELDPESINARVGLAAAHFVTEDYDAALEAYLAAQKVAPGHPVIHWGLVMTYDHLGQPQDAKIHFEKFKTLAPDSDHVAELERLVNKE